VRKEEEKKEKGRKGSYSNHERANLLVVFLCKLELSRGEKREREALVKKKEGKEEGKRGTIQGLPNEPS